MPPPDSRPAARNRWALVLVLVALCYVVQGLIYARTLLPSADMVQYLVAGRLAVRGEISLYDDRLPGNRPPLPFYALGLTQLHRPNLILARWMNVGWGVLTLVLVALLARRLAGAGAGLLAALFLATQGVVVAYYSDEGYFAFSAFCFMLALYVLMTADGPRGRLLAMLLVGLLFFVRSNVWPAIPFLAAYGLWRAADGRERALLLAAVVAQPLAFFAWDPRHLKILAYVPVLDRFVAPLGYVSALVLDNRAPLSMRENVFEAVRLVRRYEFWVAAAAVLGAIRAYQGSRGHPLRTLLSGREALLLALFGYLLACQLVMFSWNWKWVGVYFLPFAPIVAVLLGTGFATLLQELRSGSRARRALVVGLAGLLLLPPLYFVRHPGLPVGPSRAKESLRAVHVAADHLRAVVPPRASVFLYGWTVGYYLSGLPQTHLQQVYSDWHLAGRPASDFTLRKSGFVPLGDVRRWLGAEDDYAVIDPRYLAFWGPDAYLGAPRLMQELLDRHFERIATVSDYEFVTYDVYRRRRP